MVTLGSVLLAVGLLLLLIYFFNKRDHWAAKNKARRLSVLYLLVAMGSTIVGITLLLHSI